MPSQEEIRRFWEKFGFKRLPEGKTGYHWEQCKKVMNWMPPDYKETFQSMPYLPKIDLNNLFRWAIPQTIIYLMGHKTYDRISATKLIFDSWLREYVQGGCVDFEGSLYNALNKLIEEEK